MDILSVRSRETLWLSGCAAGLGAAWGQSPAALAFVPGLWGVLWLARSRLQAWALVALYHVVAARSLLVGGARFFELSLWQASALLLLGAAIASAPYALAWCSRERMAHWPELTLRVLLAYALATVPPVGAFSVASPLPAAGLWFPGTGWWGLCGLIAFGVWLRAEACPARVLRRWRLATIAMCVAYGVFAQRSVPSVLRIDALQTGFASSRSDLVDFGRQWEVAQASIALVRVSRQPIVVLPEAAAGLWLPPMQRVWAPLAKRLDAEGRVALVGTTLEHEDGSLQAAAVLLGASHGVYRQRVPVPFAMWRPWSSKSPFRSNFLGRGVLPTSAAVLGVLICWEVGSSWAVLQSVAQGADVLLAVANTAWLRGTGAAQTQRQILAAWGALFALPTALSLNE